ENTESTPERNREVTPLIVNVDCPEYSVTPENPYRYDANPPRPLDTIAATIEVPIRQHFTGQNILLRGIQSAHFDTSDRQQFIKEIVARGGDIFTVRSTDPTYDMHARRCDNYNGEEILTLLQAFHTYKPKCDELPLAPVDIWQVFAAESYEEIEYLHPRHKVSTRDRYKLRPGLSPQDALLAIVVVN
ncbi:hypothetical protein HG434_000370, partial [Candidatus Saccharibacteria bacterium]|nr:hypothetical protein [Candidatus Saccharibacteria bacterium]